MLLVLDAIQMGIHNICLYIEVRKKYNGWNQKTTELLDCALKEVDKKYISPNLKIKELLDYTLKGVLG